MSILKRLDAGRFVTMAFERRLNTRLVFVCSEYDRSREVGSEETVAE